MTEAAIFLMGCVFGALIAVLALGLWADRLARAAMAEDRNEFGEGD